MAKIALKWMFDEARLAGLVLDERKVSLVLGECGKGYAALNHNGYLHESLTPFWKPVEFIPKLHWEHEQTTWRANRSRRRTWPPKPWVHDAAWLRQDGRYAERLPPDAIRLSVAQATKTEEPDH